MAAGFSAGWRQVGACAVLLGCCGMIAATYSIIAVPFEAEFKQSRMVLMLAMTVMAGVSGLISPVLGNLMDRVSLRLMMGTGALLLALGYAALSLTTSFNQVLAIFGLLIAPANVLLGPIGATVLLSRWFVNRRGTAMGIAIAGIAAGGFVFPFIIQGLIDAFGWRQAMQLLALVIAALTVPAALLVVNRPSDLGLHPDGAASDPQVARQGATAPPLSVRAILGDPTFWLMVLIVSIVTSGMKGMVTNLSFVATDVGISATTAASLVSVYAGAGFIAKLAFAALADRVSPRVLMAISLAGFALGMAGMILAENGYAMIFASVLLIGLFGGLMVPMNSFLPPRVFGAAVVGKATGLMSAVQLVFLLSTPLIFGRISDAFGSYDAIFIAFAAIAVLAVALVPLVRLHPRAAAGSADDDKPADDAEIEAALATPAA